MRIVALQNHSRTAMPWFLRGGQANQKHSDRWHSQMEWIPEGECSREKRSSEHGKNTGIAAAIAVSTKKSRLSILPQKPTVFPNPEERTKKTALQGGVVPRRWVRLVSALLLLLERDQRWPLPKSTAGRSAQVDTGTQREVQLAQQVMVNAKQRNDTNLRPQRHELS